MPIPLTQEQVLERYFLEMRCKVLDLAAGLDRLERAAGAGQVYTDPRVENLQKAIRTLLEARPDHATRVQMIFSDAYDAGWARPDAGRAGN